MFLQKQTNIHNSLDCHPEKALGSDIDDVTCRVVIYSPLQQIIICIDFHADGTCAILSFLFFLTSSPPFFLSLLVFQLLATRLHTRRETSGESKNIENTERVRTLKTHLTGL